MNSQLPTQIELMNSMGQNALGREFRVAGVPNTPGGFYKSNFFGILAVEDNTQIIISGWPTGTVLSGTPTVLPTSVMNYTLNEGESITFAVENTIPENLDAQLGLLIQSNEDIVLQNGSWHGSALVNMSGQDVFIEQSVPTDKIGDEFIIHRGEEVDTLELTVITAHQNNTDIFLNGSVTPSYSIDAGEYQIIDGSEYQSNGNLHVETSFPVYCYQLISEDQIDGKSSGLVHVPPISCALNNSFESISNFEALGGYSFSSKLIIVSRTNDTVWVEDNSGIQTLLPNTGLAVLGSTNWETHKVLGVTGDFSVRSNSGISLTAYGGFYQSTYASSFGGFDPQPGSKTTIQDSTCLNAPFQFSFSGSSNSAFTFDYSGGQLISGSGVGPYEMSFDSLGVFTVSLIENGTQCPDTQEIHIAVIDEYQPNFTQVGDSELCPDESVWFYVDSNQAHLSISWFDGGGGYSRQVSNSGVVWYLAQGLCGTYSDTVSVSAITEPEFTTFNDTLLCGTEELMVEVNDPENHYAYQWADGYVGADRLIDSSGVYELLASNDCGTFSSGPLTIDFGTCHCHVWIPNAFTPNGNRLNEGYGVEYDCSLETFEMEIYNRWGQKLYHAFSADDKWDGRCSGEMSATGVYLYIITYTYRNDYGSLVRESKEGTLTLLR